MDSQASSVWKQALARIENKVSQDNFNLWFASLRCTGADHESRKLRIAAPNPFMKDWILDYYIDVILSELRAVAGQDWSVELHVSPLEAARPANFNVAKRVPSQATQVQAAVQTLGPRPSLNPRFSFENFVVGDSNAIAHAAAQSVAQTPGRSYNPLFLYAGTGLGKTHLLQAIGHEILKQHHLLRLCYLSAESFMNELISSIRKGEMDAFHTRYRNGVDVLLIDDVQFIAGKSSTQEEFFHTFNFLHDQGKQIVISADAYPREIKDLDERLRSRFQSGLVADIKAPAVETRVAILRRKAEAERIPLPEDVALFIAQSCPGNVRELEGALIRVEAFSNLTSKPLSNEVAREALKNYLQLKSSRLDADGIVKFICAYYKIKAAALKGKGRSKKVVFPRQVAVYLLKKYTKLSLQEIGQTLGGRDHSTVLHSLSKIEEMMLEDIRVQHELELLQKKLEKGEMDF